MSTRGDDERYWLSASTKEGASLRLAQGLRSHGRKGRVIAWIWLAAIAGGLLLVLTRVASLF